MELVSFSKPEGHGLVVRKSGTAGKDLSLWKMKWMVGEGAQDSYRAS